MTISDLYPYLILIGSSMLVAAAWLLYQYRTHNQQYKELISLNESLEYDLPDFLRQCWPALNSGGVSGFAWELDWYGVSLKGEQGKLAGFKIHETFNVEDVSLIVTLFQRKKSWEKRYFTHALAEHFFLLLRMNLWIKVGTVQGTFDQSAKMSVFLQHDMKNMLQLITLTADQLEHPASDQEGKLLDVLRAAIPAIRDRAQHMLKALVQPSRNAGDKERLDLSRVFASTASMYELPVSISGDGKARVSVASETLQSIVDNLLGNYSRQAQKPGSKGTNLEISIEQQEDLITARLTDTNGEPCLWPERLFEPFWSEHGSGRGIGLYQARQQARSAGGMLHAESPHEAPLSFILSLPGENQGDIV